MNNWNKITDQLPSKNGKYLTWDGKDINFKYFKDGYFLMLIFPEVRYDCIPFTHWMNLPEPPKDV